MNDPLAPHPSIPRDVPPWERLRAIVAHLRGPDGCPWDREQTHATIRAALLEECHEVIDAIDRDHPGDLREELGDLLLHVLLHSRIAEEAGRFDIDQVVDTLAEKLVRRHPHVFGPQPLDDSDAVIRQWEEIKRAEKRHDSHADTLASVPRSLPALLRAEKLQRRASRLGLDWTRTRDVIEKTREELDEFAAAAATPDPDPRRLADEIGDLLFSAVNLARFAGADPELALHASAERFVQRIRHIERRLAADRRSFQDCSPEELDALWRQAKAALDTGPTAHDDDDGRDRRV